jgi:hypothetical protein
MALAAEFHADLEQKSLLRVRAALERQHPSPDRIGIPGLPQVPRLTVVPKGAEANTAPVYFEVGETGWQLNLPKASPLDRRCRRLRALWSTKPLSTKPLELHQSLEPTK